MTLYLLPIHAPKITEQIDPENVETLISHIIKEKVWTQPICVERSSLAVMDGHHRLQAAKRLGLAMIPALKFSYEEVTLCSWRHDYTVTPQDILRRAQTGELYPVKTTRHLFSEQQTRPICLDLESLRPVANT